MALYAGIMSGTSLDGIDVAIADISVTDPRAERPEFTVQLAATGYQPYSEALRARLQTLRHGKPVPIAEVCRLHYELGALYAAAVLAVAAEAEIALAELTAVGLHGQTVWHAPPSSGIDIPATLQLGQPALLAERLGVAIVSDFRARDIAAGGEGAPLVPFADYALLSSPAETRVVLNIGGIANLTYLAARGRLSEVIAFDTGPGNLLIDGVTLALTGALYDAGGALAAQGVPDQALLRDFLDAPYFRLPPPKSTGAELFDAAFVASLLSRGRALPPANLIATVTQLTVATIIRAMQDFLPRLPDRVIVGGGGAHNQTLLAGLKSALPDIPIASLEEFGIPGDFKEALAFALLAAANRLGIPANIPTATGAEGFRLLGSVTLP